jgi:U3 small nucleolar RNA-associated protein 3
MVLAWWDQLQSSDEEEPAEEEAEATRLQQQMAASLRPEDYEIDEVESEMSDEDTLEVILTLVTVSILVLL